jgi:glycosyltransferase involved in cell wall biosynthesis
MNPGAERPDRSVVWEESAAWLGRSDRVKVLYLTLVGDYSGAERGQSEVVIADRDALVACPPDTRMDQYAKSLGAGTVPVGLRSLRHSGGITEGLLSVFRGFACVREVRGHLKRNPDRVIVYCFQIRPGLVASLATIGLSRAVVWHLTDFLPPPPLKQAIRLVARLRADRLIAHSGVIADDFAGARQTLRDRITLIHPGVDVPREVSDDRRPATASAAIVGHVSPTKHTGLALDIAARVIAERPDFELFVVGRAQYRDEDFAYERMLHERVAADPLLSGRVHFVGYSESVMRTLSDVTMLLHCRPDEPYGIVVLEAMAAARPVVGPAACGLRETVVDGVTGLLYPTGDVEQAARHVLALIADPALALSMGAAGRRRAQEHFSKQEQLRATDQLLADMASHAERRSAGALTR